MADSSDDNRGPTLLAVNITLGVITVLIVLMRIYSRAVLVKAFGIDDWVILVATAFFIVYCTLSTCGVHYGTGQHEASLSDQNIKRAMMYWWYCYLFFSLTMVTSKLSFAWFILRITNTKIHSYIIYCASLCTVLAGVIFFFVTMFQCRPIAYYWDKNLEGKCLGMNIIMALAYLYSVFSLITDFTFAILPGFLVWNLKLKMRAKLAIITLITMGCVASSAVLVRCGYLEQFKNPDFLWATSDIAIWSTVEMGLAISAASLATLRPLARVVAAKLGIATKSTASSRTPYAGTMLAGGILQKPSNDDGFNNHVYIQSDVSQDVSSPAKGTRWNVGTYARAYTDSNKNEPTTSETEIAYENNSQERLHYCRLESIPRGGT